MRNNVFKNKVQRRMNSTSNNTNESSKNNTTSDDHKEQMIGDFIENYFKIFAGTGAMFGTILAPANLLENNRKYRIRTGFIDNFVILPMTVPLGFIYGGVAGVIIALTWPITLPIYLASNRQ